MSVILQSFGNGDTDYINKHNSNKSIIQNALNLLQTDMASVKAATGFQALVDYRQLAFNLLINSAFDFWQRGVNDVPDAWVKDNVFSDINFIVSQEPSDFLNTYSAKFENKGRLTQVLDDSFRKSFGLGSSISFGAYVKTDVDDSARIAISINGVDNFSQFSNGSGEFEFLLINFTQISNVVPTEIKLKIESLSGETFFNSLAVIRGNPNSGPYFIVNDTTLEQLRVFSLFEIGRMAVSGLGYINDFNDRVIDKYVQFKAAKRSSPDVQLISDLPTGFDYDIINVDEFGFVLRIIELGVGNDTTGFTFDDLLWQAEVN